MEINMKKIVRVNRRVEYETAGVKTVWPKDSDICFGRSDILNDDGLRLYWGHGRYSTIPRDAFEVITIHTETIVIETLVGEDGRFIEMKQGNRTKTMGV